MLAAASATCAGRPGAAALLDEALDVLLTRFWDEEHGMVVEEWDESFSTLDAYRGVNANMHTVEALLAAADATGDRSLLDKALRILTRVVHDLGRGTRLAAAGALRRAVDPAAGVQRRQAGRPVPPVRRDHRPLAGVGPAGPAPAGRARLRRRRTGCSTTPSALFDASVREGWAVDGADGFVYTVDWSGEPVVRERMHWVAAEATATAAALHAATGDPAYDGWYATWWDHIAEVLPRPRAGVVAPRARPAEPAQRRGLERQAGHLPRVPGDPDPAAAADADPRGARCATGCSTRPDAHVGLDMKRPPAWLAGGRCIVVVRSC